MLAVFLILLGQLQSVLPGLYLTEKELRQARYAVEGL